MLKVFSWLILGLFSSLSSAANEPLSKSAADGLQGRIRVVQHMAMNLSIVSSVKKQNAEKLSQGLITERDDAWKKSKKTLTPLKRQLMQNQAGQFLKRRIESSSGFNEAFLTDNQGANVAVYPPTSDYWQGDEDKWSQSFNQGNGQVYIGPVEKDESTQVQAVQVSVPVIDHGKTIGVLVVGVKIN